MSIKIKTLKKGEQVPVRRGRAKAEHTLALESMGKNQYFEVPYNRTNQSAVLGSARRLGITIATRKSSDTTFRVYRLG